MRAADIASDDRVFGVSAQDSERGENVHSTGHRRVPLHIALPFLNGGTLQL
jgi:hypothetical protein